ncbi:carbamoyltransferase [bacterium]|nr:carbamoyltransferase [bacterium]
MTSILGISAFYHDSAASIIIDGKIISAAQEERFTRIKHDSNFPFNSIKFVLNFSKLKLSDIDHIVFYEKPFLKFERLLETYINFAPRGFQQFSKAMPIWLKEKLFQKKYLFDCLQEIDLNFNNQNKIFFSEHHLSHAASAFFPSNFDEAIILTADGVGEWATTTVSIGKGNNLEIVKEINFPNSLGLLYSAFTYYCGFKVNSGEYKLMGLAPYGKPVYENLIRKHLVDVKEDGSFRLNQKYFNYTVGLTMTNENFNQLFGNEVRDSQKDDITQFHMDIAASIQKVIEDIMLKICQSLRDEFKIKNLCLAGGVALNCVANGKILNKKIFKDIWIQPASGDAGGSIGGALAFWYLELKKNRTVNEHKDEMNGSYLGPEYSNDEIISELKKLGAVFEEFDEKELLKNTANLISEKNAIGWFQGRMEFGPRALGARSIIADPRSSSMQKNLNLKVKFRESFRPFAPSVLKHEASNWFDIEAESPYMLLVSQVKENKRKKLTELEENLFGIEKLNVPRSSIPAVTHVDYSARVQTVNNYNNHRYYGLLEEFFLKTKCPVLVNTSFNVRGEPIVNSPKDAFKCFMGTNLDYLVIGNFILDKKKQHENLLKEYKDNFELD